ncbi:RNA polymerase II mediator complex subunit [Recurvomyces mirabilis]|uniref:Mediator of RNA polymerase II transcription subunit 12 n=1 Tax=Recurvomyces mirabilis TaxID=574656 RepID=A0AAE0WMD8_9PEZI|nr:RNA polymerase II mediator complex subunit [Recurvomyces mirabilis]KAK5154234.1 RNA polymerase II mediator complex subunit [Recurvomyces mirabilis]
MDHRRPLSAAATTTRPLPPQRAVSGSALYFPKPIGRPSRLSSVRSVSQSAAGVVDLTAESAGRNHGGVFGERRETLLVGSPEVIELEDEEEQRPAKRAKLAPEEDEDEEAGSAGASRDDMAHAIVPGEKLPSLPKQNTSNSRSVLARRRRYGGESSARKANGIEPPPMATRIPPPKNVADFSPWTGQHAEDVLNENIVKVGYSDKPPTSIQTECNSAKASIWNNLSTKNSAGLQMLGYLFTQVMEKRQTLGKCNAPSTFKPPPRVTVTDTKREGWLRDLANPDIPLRKQSRTIPHGVRGKLLMDQCLSKDIPLQRAVWLAKCVGANELRAFRRKGVSGAAAATGESKWIREWTISVEQFLEGVIATCGEEDWQMRMGYAIKLVTAFHTEQLLDKDHYLDWIVASFGEAELERLPVWIVVLQIYWKDIVRFIRRGRKLALIMLERLTQLSEDSSGVNAVLRTRLQKLVAILAVTSRGSLVTPEVWDKYKVLLAPTEMAKTNEALRAVAVSVAGSNERLKAPLNKTPSNTRSSVLRLYDMLDTVGLEIDHTALSTSCIELVPHVPDLVNALFDWTASPYRQGLARVYLSARIIKILRSNHHDTDSAISAYIARISPSRAMQHDNIHRLIGELVRETAFSAGSYLQWLASSGALYDASSVRVAKRVLGAIPAGSLPGHLAGLRRSLLSRLEYAEEVEMIAAPSIQILKSALADGSLKSLELVASTTV